MEIQRKEILSSPDYHLVMFQGEMFRLVATHIEKTGHTIEDIAELTNCTSRIIKSILNGTCRLSIITMLDICAQLGYAPKFSFVEIDNYDDDQDLPMGVLAKAAHEYLKKG